MLKGKAPLIIAIVLGVVAVLVAWRAIRMREMEVTRGWELEDVIVAATDIQPGTALSSDTVRVDKMPRKFVYESVLVPADMEVALGREVIVPIKRGEPVHWYQLQGIRSLERLSKAVRKTGRAISIDVSERSAVGLWVRPNDHVDVLGTFRDPNANQMVAVTLLQNVIVLATGQTTAATESARSDKSYGTATLLVLPEEAEILVLAQEMGSEVFKETVKEAGERLNSVDDLKKLAESITSQEARELIFSALYDIAVPGTIVEEEAKVLQWLANAWNVYAPI